jgi:hypothetical protein
VDRPHIAEDTFWPKIDKQFLQGWREILQKSLLRELTREEIGWYLGEAVLILKIN